ncbi:uncharacterized protein [Prorops nasuta]|uniref:uncharacterized protein n=1 Tax=Prorops nasuta TaxID=863751 RepID=UPI0034CE011E
MVYMVPDPPIIQYFKSIQHLPFRQKWKLFFKANMIHAPPVLFCCFAGTTSLVALAGLIVHSIYFRDSRIEHIEHGLVVLRPNDPSIKRYKDLEFHPRVLEYEAKSGKAKE